MPNVVARSKKGERSDRPTTWRLSWELERDENGKRRRITETFEGTKSEANARWYQRQAEIDLAGKTFIPPARDPIGKWLEEWYARHSPEIELKTQETYERTIQNHLIPRFGRIPLGDLTPLLAQRRLEEMRKDGLSIRDVRYARMILRASLQEAVRLGVLRTNPLDGTRIRKGTTERVVNFSVEEVQVLFGVIKGTRYEALIRFAVFIGMRRGELVGLRWADIDWEHKTVTVCRSRGLVKGKGVTGKTKTEAGARTIALPAKAMDALRLQLEIQDRDRSAAGEKWQGGQAGEDGWVFANQYGGPLDPSKAYQGYARLRNKVEIPKHSFHSLRHTSASIQLAAGVPLEIVSKRLGHKNISTTADIYGHLLPQTDRDAADMLGNFLNRFGL